MSEEFDLRRVARKVVEDYPFVTGLDTLVEVIEGRVPDSALRVALRQCLRPLVEKVFEEFSSLKPTSSLYLTPSKTILSAPATPDRGDSDQPTFDTHCTTVAVTSSPAGTSSDHSTPDPHCTAVAAPLPRPRRTKASLVRSAAQTWMEQRIRTGGGGIVSLGSATFDDLMAATKARRRSAYTAMAKADTLERLARLVESSGVSTVSELPPRLLNPFIASNPELG